MAGALPPRRLAVKPPDKGSFPLDHDGQCKDIMTIYMTCLKKNKQDNDQCRIEARNYLGCRMNNDLMAKEDWSKLGYKDLEMEKTATPIKKS